MIHPTAASPAATAATPAPQAAASQAFQDQLAVAQVTQDDAGAVPAQEADPTAPPALPPPPPPAIADAPTTTTSTTTGSSSAGDVQPVGESPDGQSFDGASATSPASPSGGSTLLAALGLPPALQRIIREARRFVPDNATLHIFSNGPGAFRGRFVVPQNGVLNSVPPPPAAGRDVPARRAGDRTCRGYGGAPRSSRLATHVGRLHPGAATTAAVHSAG